MNLLTLFTAHKASASGLGGLAAGAFAAEVVAPTVVSVVDWTGIALVIGAIAGLIGAVIGPIMSIVTARNVKAQKADIDAAVKAALDAKAAADAANAKSEETSKNVDGKMKEMVQLTASAAADKATLAEKAAQAERESIAERAAAKALASFPAQLQQPVVTPAPENPVTGNTPAAEVHVTRDLP